MLKQVPESFSNLILSQICTLFENNLGLKVVNIEMLLKLSGKDMNFKYQSSYYNKLSF